MKSRATCLPFLFFLFLWSACSGEWADETPHASPEQLPFQELFTQKPASPWIWIRENTETYKVVNPGLAIRLEPGGLMGAGQDARNILVRPLPESAHTVQVSVEVEFEHQYEQAGLIIYQDDDNYLKLVREFVDGVDWVVLVAEQKMEARVVNRVPAPDGLVWLELTINGENIVAVCWGENQSRVEVGRTPFPMRPRPQVGIFTQSGQPNVEHWAIFESFSIK